MDPYKELMVPNNMLFMVGPNFKSNNKKKKDKILLCSEVVILIIEMVMIIIIPVKKELETILCHAKSIINKNYYLSELILAKFSEILVKVKLKL